MAAPAFSQGLNDKGDNILGEYMSDRGGSKSKIRITKNADGSYKAKTSHTLNPVPCIIYDNNYKDAYTIKDGTNFGLANVAATAVNLLGYEAPEMWCESLIEIK